MNHTYRKKLLIDLDGVLNEYSGNYDEKHIPPPKEGAKALLQKLSKEFDVKVFTSRNLFAANKWLKDYELHKYILGVTNIKEPAYLTVDDRCIKFEGNYSHLIEQISNFKVWYKN